MDAKTASKLWQWAQGWLDSEFYSEYVKLTGLGGAEPNISDVQLLDFVAPHPTLEEQAATDLLDSETIKIDNLAFKIEEAIDRLDRIPHRPHHRRDHGQD